MEHMKNNSITPSDNPKIAEMRWRKNSARTVLQRSKAAVCPGRSSSVLNREPLVAPTCSPTRDMLQAAVGVSDTQVIPIAGRPLVSL